jgi:hypothetical protein
MICDTCGKETPFVSRVVIDKGYNRSNAKPVYNCPECFEKKNRSRSDHDESPQPAGATPASAGKSAA